MAQISPQNATQPATVPITPPTTSGGSRTPVELIDKPVTPLPAGGAGYLRLFYFLLFIGIGSSTPFASIFLKRVLVSPDGRPAIELIGIIYTILPLIGIVANMAAALIADRFHLGRKIIVVNCIISAVAAVLIAQSAQSWTVAWSLQQRFGFIVVLMILLGFGIGPIHGLLDAETLHHLNRHGSREKYGTFRLWGTYGWSVAAIGMGGLLTLTANLGCIYYGAALGYLLLGIAAGFKVSGSKLERPAKIPLSHLRHNRRFQIFLLFIFLNGLIYNTATNYLGYFFDDIMRDFWQIGLIFGTWTIFEIPIMLYSHKIMARWGNRRLLAVGLAFNALRLLLFSTFTLQTPYALKFAIALLQGPAFALTHIGFIDYVDRQAHPHLRATYLSVASLVQNTIGASVGGILGGLVISHMGSAALFRICGFAIFGLMFFFLFAVKSDGSRDSLSK
jgi:PPP family 3-phenylpropionic acid transporter